MVSSWCRCSVSSVPSSGLELSSHAEESRVRADRLLTGSPASRARVGWMLSRRVTAAAVRAALPKSRKVAVVCTHLSVTGRRPPLTWVRRVRWHPGRSSAGFPDEPKGDGHGTMEPKAAETPPEFDVRQMVAGASLLAATANVIMQLARPEVGYGVVESTVESAQLMRHPVRRWLTTVTYLSVALMGTPGERAAVRHMINRSHAQVRSTAGSPVAYNAFDPGLQLWIAACLYQGAVDVHTALRGPADEQTADGMYQVARWFGRTLQMPGELWPADREAFQSYWETELASVRIDPPVRDYLGQLLRLVYLPTQLWAVLGTGKQL